MSLPVISVAQMREWEQVTWASGQTEAAVIARVGEALANHALALTRTGDAILLVAGRGHNGDDVRAMRSHLPHRQFTLVEVTEPDTALPTLRAALANKPALIVDGLFGIGLSRPLNQHWLEIIRALNHSASPILAVDVPSGLDAETGQPLPEAVHAAITVTVGAPKAGLLPPSASEFVGRLEIAHDVGLIPCPCASDLLWTERTDFAGFPPRRPAGGHKGTFGHVGIVAGSLGYHGAAILAARGAQRARPGLVTLFTQSEVYLPVAAQLQAAMVHPWRDDINLTRYTALLFGPGLAAMKLPRALRVMLAKLWVEAVEPIIVDASALEWMPAERGNGLRVITPHPGEAARLIGVTTAEVQQDRPKALRALAKKFHCLVVLKGQNTLVGGASGPIHVNSSGNPDLAQGGSGDLLAGYLTGLLAQPALQSDPLTAIRWAVFEHGDAADRLSKSRRNWIVEDLAVELGQPPC